MSRILAAILAGLLFAGAALAQATGAAPATHPGTKLSFPPALGGATFQQSFAAGAGKEASYSYHYLTPNKMQIAVYVYDAGRRVPSGGDNPTIISQFSAELSLAEQGIKSNGITNFERPAVPSHCTYGGIAFRCIVVSGSTQGGRLFSKMLLTGFRDYYVKIRIDWAQADGRTVVDADQVLQAFVPALMH